MSLSQNEDVTLPKILVIDDEAAIRDTISVILERKGHSVVLAEDGIRGVAKYRTELPDLVVTDMNMPEQGGAETIARIRQETPDARIIAVSGGGVLDATHPLVLAKKLGAVEILRKPFTARELVDCVARALSRLLVRNSQHSSS